MSVVVVVKLTIKRFFSRAGHRLYRNLHVNNMENLLLDVNVCYSLSSKSK